MMIMPTLNGNTPFIIIRMIEKSFCVIFLYIPYTYINNIDQSSRIIKENIQIFDVISELKNI